MNRVSPKITSQSEDSIQLEDNMTDAKILGTDFTVTETIEKKSNSFKESFQSGLSRQFTLIQPSPLAGKVMANSQVGTFNDIFGLNNHIFSS